MGSSSSSPDEKPPLKCQFLPKIPKGVECPEEYCSGDGGFPSFASWLMVGPLGSIFKDLFGPDLCIPRETMVILNWLAILLVVGIISLIFGNFLSPLTTVFGYLLEFALWIGGYLERGIGYFFSLWSWLYTQMRDLIETLRVSVDGNTFIFYSFGILLAVYSLLYVLLGFWQSAQQFMSTPIFMVYRFLNTPFRWIRINLLQEWFGVVLGNLISFFFVPIEVVLFLISLPVGGIIWLFQTVRDRRI